MGLKFSVTTTTIFLLPQLRIPREQLLDKENNFINCFLRDQQATLQYENSIIVLFKPTNFQKFSEFVQSERERTDSLLDEYDYEEGYTALVYQLPEGFEDDIAKFYQGKYSKFSTKFQEAYPEYLIVKDHATGKEKKNKGLAWRIINKTQDIREFWENKLNVVFDPEDEIWQSPSGKNGINSDEILNIGVKPVMKRRVIH